jgi:transposase
MAKQHDKQFKLDAIQYYQDHKDLGVRGCAENLGIGYSTLTKWLKDFRESGDIPVRGSGNYAWKKETVFPLFAAISEKIQWNSSG